MTAVTSDARLSDAVDYLIAARQALYEADEAIREAVGERSATSLPSEVVEVQSEVGEMSQRVGTLAQGLKGVQLD